MNRSTLRLQAWLAFGLIVIVSVMPFHAFLSVWLGSLTGHQALIQAWKEGLIVLLGLLAAVGLIIRPHLRASLARPVIGLISVFTGIALIVTAFVHPSFAGIAYGVKTDLEFLFVFVLAILAGAALAPQRLARIILLTGSLTAYFGIILSTLLSRTFLAQFGYSAQTILPFEKVDPVIKAVRTPSTYGGPNQFGAFMLLPLAIALSYLITRRRWYFAVAALLALGGVVVSYSRAAWVGAMITIIVAVILALPKRYLGRVIVATASITLVLGIALGLVVGHSSKLTYYLLHQNPKIHTANPASTTQHLRAFGQGVQIIVQHPLGEGLGSAGPASYHTNSPFIPESFYLQIGIETGIAGLVVFVVILLRLVFDLLKLRTAPEAQAALAALAGVSVVCLVLHGWTDSSLALVYWIFAGSIVGSGSSLLREKISMVGVEVDNVTLHEAVERIAQMMASREGGLIATVNAEFVVNAHRDHHFAGILNHAALAVADGSGLTIMGRLIGQPFKSRIPGVDLTEAVLKRAAEEGWRVFIFGGFNDSGHMAAKIWKKRYPGLNIVGVSQPAPALIDDVSVIKEVKAARPDLILVALGGERPRQEPWIAEHLPATGAVAAIGIGGTFDIVAGHRQRAPHLMRRLGLEWLHRLITQPHRWRRMLALPYFVYLVLRYRNRSAR